MHVYVSRVKDAIANFSGVVEAVPEFSAVDDEGGDDGDGGLAGSDSSWLAVQCGPARHCGGCAVDQLQVGEPRVAALCAYR